MYKESREIQEERGEDIFWSIKTVVRASLLQAKTGQKTVRDMISLLS